MVTGASCPPVVTVVAMSSMEPQRLRQLLDAVVTIGSGLDLTETLGRIIELATKLVDARFGALGVLDPTGTRLSEFLTVGIDDETHRKIGHLPEGHGILGVLIVDARPLRLPDLATHPESAGFPPHHPDMTSFLGVPILVRGQVFGNLYLTEKMTEAEFTELDQELVEGLAVAAGVAIENARLYERVADLALDEDRQRIARDLHDLVIQRLFATGLSLQGVLSSMARDPDTAHTRVEAAIDDLDETVRTIRTTIFALEGSRRAGPSLRDQLVDASESAVAALGFRPRVTFEGPVDTLASEAVTDDAVATLREALTNVARHARATEVSVRVCAIRGALQLEVADDGVGPTSRDVGQEGHGLRNIADRARRHGGSSALEARTPHGSVLRWSVPLPDLGLDPRPSR